MSIDTSELTPLEISEFALKVLEGLGLDRVRHAGALNSVNQITSLVVVLDIVENPPATEVTEADYLNLDIDLSRGVTNAFWATFIYQPLI